MMGHHPSRALPARIALVMLALVAPEASCNPTFAPVLCGHPGLPRAVSLPALRTNRGGLVGNTRGNDLPCAGMPAGLRPVWGGLLALRGGKQTDKDKNMTDLADSESEEVEEETLGRGEEIHPKREPGTEKWDEEGTVVKEVLKAGNARAPFPEIGDLVSMTLCISAAGKEVVSCATAVSIAKDEWRPDRPDAQNQISKVPRPVTPEQAEQIPLQELYAYGGEITEATLLSDGEPIPGTMGLRVGQGAEILPPALEEAVMAMRPGETARFTLSGKHGFGAPGFRSVARECKVPCGADMEVEITVKDVNRRFVTPDGGVEVLFSKEAARVLHKMEKEGEWRLMLRRPSRHAEVLLRLQRLPDGSSDKHGSSGTGVEAQVLLRLQRLPDGSSDKHGTSGTGVEWLKRSSARWVTLGTGAMSEGVSLALREAIVLRVPLTIRVRGKYRKKEPVSLPLRSTGEAAKEGCDMGEGGGDAVMRDGEGGVDSGVGVGEGVGEEEGEDGGVEEWGLLVEDWSETRDLMGDGGILLMQERVGSLETLLRPISDGDTVELCIRATASTAGSGDEEVEWLSERTEHIEVGNFARAAGLERALLGLRVGQKCSVHVRGQYLHTFVWRHPDKQKYTVDVRGDYVHTFICRHPDTEV
ncbi:hypothetical protein T484DRAFT_1878287 [Baffinella frigidus]|nr:hypothetical protein T484DRAFT_1878287 [Cryptophyta sp. CCMP2293]